MFNILEDFYKGLLETVKGICNFDVLYEFIYVSLFLTIVVNSKEQTSAAALSFSECGAFISFSTFSNYKKEINKIQKKCVFCLNPILFKINRWCPLCSTVTNSRWRKVG